MSKKDALVLTQRIGVPFDILESGVSYLSGGGGGGAVNSVDGLTGDVDLTQTSTIQAIDLEISNLDTTQQQIISAVQNNNSNIANNMSDIADLQTLVNSLIEKTTLSYSRLFTTTPFSITNGDGELRLDYDLVDNIGVGFTASETTNDWVLNQDLDYQLQVRIQAQQASGGGSDGIIAKLYKNDVELGSSQEDITDDLSVTFTFDEALLKGVVNDNFYITLEMATNGTINIASARVLVNQIISREV